ncbi:Na+/solute symporter [Dacryopinax primogenitus]|uniref:Na+/solute symporter n=1 Tax=Dacryopinax primogenitus (strain DJM 731) TaxID=1858805 RepID=M5FNB4_DACPD|nr:Na+/solute symporter [Dacryopinax primogenitus]EJT97150.1 Na+/solute symporter [Dacryopinax primogenitus]
MPLFSQSVGYGMVIGVGAAFAVLMGGVSWVLSKFMLEVQDSEMMMTAKRSIKTGLVASAVVSSWTIGSTLLLSSTSAYSWGVSGPWWYGGGACVQIILFATAAIELKRIAPNAHTFQELVRVRYGKTTHLLMCTYSFIQQITYSANLLINGSSVFSTLTGMNRDAAIVLFPIGVICYTLIGGIKATILTDWTHTLIIYVLMLMFLFTTYATSDIIGSPGRMWDLLQEAGRLNPIAGNYEGSFTTMSSRQGGLFGLVLFGAGWAASVDSQLFQKAIASNPASALGGYVLGGICWFTIPFCLATTLGLACAAMEHLPVFPTYPNRMSAAEVGAGLVMPYAAITLLGKTGGGAVLTMIFMAVTAAFSSETVAVSALYTYDIYQAYINPSANGKTLVRVGHASVVGFGVITIALAIGLAHAGFDVGFITTVSGVVVDVCIVPMAGTLFWKKQSKWAFIFGTTLSTCAALAIWIGYTHVQSGVVNLTTLGTNEALAAGNISAIGIPLLLVPIITFLKPDNFDFATFKQIQKVDDSSYDETHGLSHAEAEKAELALTTHLSDGQLWRSRNIAAAVSLVFVLFYLVLFPLPLYGTNYVFSREFFTGWIVVAFLWAWFAAIVIICLPLVEGRKALSSLFSKLIAYVNQRGSISQDEMRRTAEGAAEYSIGKDDQGSLKNNDAVEVIRQVSEP